MLGFCVVLGRSSSSPHGGQNAVIKGARHSSWITDFALGNRVVDLGAVMGWEEIEKLDDCVAHAAVTAVRLGLKSREDALCIAVKLLVEHKRAVEKTLADYLANR